MEQLNLFETIEERLRRAEEIRHPWVLLRRSSSHLSRLVLLSMPLSAIVLLGIRVLYGRHEEGEEIVVISTPLMLAYLGTRFARTQEPPVPEHEIVSAAKPTLQEALAGIFAFGIILLVLSGLSSLIYGHLGIHWAEEASRTFVKRGFAVMTLLAVAIFLASDQGRRATRKLVRVSITIPGIVRTHIEALIPPARVVIRLGHRIVLLVSGSFLATLLRSTRDR
jgi:hypothetical protein